MAWIIVGIVCIALGCIVLFSDKDNSNIPGQVVTLDSNKDTISITYIYKTDSI